MNRVGPITPIGKPKATETSVATNLADTISVKARRPNWPAKAKFTVS